MRHGADMYMVSGVRAQPSEKGVGLFNVIHIRDDAKREEKP